MYHGAESNRQVPCPVCGANCDGRHAEVLPVHLNHLHGAPELREPPTPALAAFSLVVCRHLGRYLLVNEPADICKGGRPAYWLPAGRLDAGEGFIDAAKRECEEEAGLAVAVLGVLSFHLDRHGTPRVVLLAEPLATGQDCVELPQPKTVPDFESCGAVWVEAAQMLATLTPADFRAPDPVRLFPPVDAGLLRAQPVDTPAFLGLEIVMRRLTLAGDASSSVSGTSEQGEQAAGALAFSSAWAGLKDAYPAALFQ